jgi:hypothetical protein
MIRYGASTSEWLAVGFIGVCSGVDTATGCRKSGPVFHFSYTALIF